MQGFGPVPEPTGWFACSIALWSVVTVVFIVMRLSGDPVPLLLPPDAPIAEMERLRHEMGLDRPIFVQYGVFVHQAVQGDFGRSIHFRISAITVVWERVPATLELAFASFLCAIVVAMPAGIISAVRRGSLIDDIVMGVALVGQAAPTFYIGIMLILTCSLWLGLFPTSGRGDWRNLVLPAVTLGAFAMASIARITRSAVLEILRADYIRTARAKGLTEFGGRSPSTPCGMPPFRSSRSWGCSSETCWAARWSPRPSSPGRGSGGWPSNPSTTAIIRSCSPASS